MKATSLQQFSSGTFGIFKRRFLTLHHLSAGKTSWSGKCTSCSVNICWNTQSCQHVGGSTASPAGRQILPCSSHSYSLTLRFLPLIRPTVCCLGTQWCFFLVISCLAAPAVSEHAFLVQALAGRLLLKALFFDIRWSLNSVPNIKKERGKKRRRETETATQRDGRLRSQLTSNMKPSACCFFYARTDFSTCLTSMQAACKSTRLSPHVWGVKPLCW